MDRSKPGCLLPRGGRWGPIGRLRDQMQRPFAATIAFTFDSRDDGEWHDAGFRVAEKTHLWWSPRQPDRAALWGSVVTLSPGFFSAVTDRPAPVDFRALKVLRSPLALDIYCWLTYRMSYLERPHGIVSRSGHHGTTRRALPALRPAWPG